MNVQGKSNFEAAGSGGGAIAVAAKSQTISEKSRGAFWDADLERYTLQPVMFRSLAEKFAPQVFFTTLEGRATRRGDGLRLDPGSRISLNNYINSFYASPWMRHTSVNSISLSGVLVGHGVLHLFKSTAYGQAMLVGSYPVGLAGQRAPFHIHFDLYGLMSGDGGGGRYFFDIQALGELDVEKISFTSFVAPPKEATFSVGLELTRPDGYAVNVALLLEKYISRTPGVILDVYVDISDEDLKKFHALSHLARRSSRFHVSSPDVEAGGSLVSRSVSVSLESSLSTHHIFMDDSAFIDPAVLTRIHALASYVYDDVVISGLMMDLKRPDIVGSWDAEFDNFSGGAGVPNEDVSSGASAIARDRLHGAGGHARWFACMPKSLATEVKLPVSPILHADDAATGRAFGGQGRFDAITSPSLFMWYRRSSVRRPNALQELLLPEANSVDPLPSELYLQLEGAAKGALHDPGYLAAPHRGLRLLQGGTLWFDSFMNTFYESYWHEACALSTICLEVEVFGRVRVGVLRHSPVSGVREIIHTDVGVEGVATHYTIEVPGPLLAADRFKTAIGRIWCRFEGLSHDARFVSGRWATWDKPKQDRRVAVVMCTFNKPKDVIRNLHLVRAAFQKEPSLARFILVDQGTDKVSSQPDFHEVSGGDKWSDQFRIVTQGNLGGAGGFTRGMMEGFADPDITDVLLLDDDIVIEPNVLLRLATLLKHSRRPQMIGGEMFDLFHRGIMHAHAERANFDNLSYEPVTPHGVDMCKRGANDLFLETVVGNYNGWWTCCLPREAIQKVGLPLPFFVRCDDSEFGSRLSAAKFPMLTFPGIFVWHEPFYAKISGLMIYYECRNFLVMATLRKGPGENGRQRAYLEKFFNYLSINLYDHAYALVLALEHYLRGPEFIFDNTQTIHGSVSSELSKYAPQVRKGGRVLVRGEVSSHLDDKLTERQKKRAILRWVYGLEGASQRETPAQAEIGELHHFNRYFLYGRNELEIYNKYTGDLYFLKRNPKLARTLTWRLIKALRVWRSRRVSLAETYKAAAAKYSTLEQWCDYLELDPQAYKAVTEIAQPTLAKVV